MCNLLIHNRWHNNLLICLVWLCFPQIANSDINDGVALFKRSSFESHQKVLVKDVLTYQSEGFKKQGSQQFRILDQQINFTNPNGYCTPGQSSKEIELVVFTKQMLQSTTLVHVAVKCDELEAFRSGRRDTLDNWMQIQLIGQKGKFKRLEISRETFLLGLSKSSEKLDMVEMQSKINSRINDLNISMSNIDVQQIGRDGNAHYMSTRSFLKYGDKVKQVNGLGGVTLINSLPLAVWIYESSGSLNSRYRRHLLLQESLKSLVYEN